MLKYKLLTVCILLLFSAQVVSADSVLERQDKTSAVNTIGSTRVDSKFSLFDPDRFSMQHSYSVSYISSNGHGQTIGLYLNSMRYQISRSVDLDVTLGWLHQPSQVFSRNEQGVNNYGRIMPNVRLLYQPSEKFRFQVSFESMPGVYTDYYRGSTWPYRRW